MNFATSDIFGGFAELGGQEVVELGRALLGLTPEEGGDDVVVGLRHLAGRQIADQSLVTLFWFSLGLETEKILSDEQKLFKKYCFKS